ncbi:Translation initiation factor 3 subunit b [Nowakowskiella sp. JEL0407]|nr:Translation initiation factor 3 subunit b [Nowakowskiella sp. JEL0407]
MPGLDLEPNLKDDEKIPTEEELLATLDFSDLELKYAIPPTPLFESVLVLDGLPIIERQKEQKFINLMITGKIFKNYKLKENGIYFPFTAENKSKGFMFLDFETPEIAAAAMKSCNGFKIDKNHTLVINKFSDVEFYTNMDDEFVEPVIKEFVEKEHLKGWLMDDMARDQWAIMRGNETGIYWNMKSENMELAHKRQAWSELNVIWSPLGSYLLTFHKPGVALWGGASFEQIVKFPHPGAKLIDFSPNERFLITWSNEPIITPEGQSHNLIVWDIVTGRSLRSFPMDTAPQQQRNAKFDWPIFKWSHDDKYLAKVGDGLIQVYETPSMGLLDKKSIKVDNIKDFMWIPNEHQLVYWTPEGDNIPARVTIIKLPSRETVRTKNLVNVSDVKMYTQPKGEFLLVKVERAKTKKQTVTHFEVFRLKEKGIPIDVLEFKPDETVVNVFWEPTGPRFAVITQEGQKTFVYFYEVVAPPVVVTSKQTSAAAVAGEVKLLKKLEKRGINSVKWSPKGRFCVLAGIRAFQGELEFWDIEEMFMMGSGEHYTCTDVEWDPTGRYVLTSVSYWVQQNDTGFQLWSLSGERLSTNNMPQFKQISWRPRPPTLLTKEQIKAMKKKMKEYTAQFEEMDKKDEQKIEGEAVEAKKRKVAEWNEYRKRCIEEYEQEKEKRIELYGFDPDLREEESEDVEEWVEEVVEEIEEIVEKDSSYDD